MCKDYFDKIKPGLASDTSYDPQEQYTINHLCETRSADLSRFAEQLDEGAAVVGAPPVDARSVKTLRAEFVKAVINSNEFDAPGYDRISIYGAVIDGDLNLAKITINNALALLDVQFLGNVDFSYSSTAHILDISGTFPEAKTLCLKGFQTTASIFINKLHYQPDNQSVQNSTSFCTDTSGSPSIGLQGARIGGQLSIRNAIAKSIDAEGAQITGQVLIQNSTILDAIDFSAATAGGFFFLEVNSPNELKEDSQCERSTVFLEGTNVQGSAEFVRSDLCGISMTGAHVSKNVNLLGSRLAFFDFSGSNAEGDLQIGPSRGPPQRLSEWLPAFGTPKANLVLSHSSVVVVRVALNNWPNMCEIGVRPEDRKGKCSSPSGLTIDFCTSQRRPLPSALPDSHDRFMSISKFWEWAGFAELISKQKKSKTTTIAADFRFKGFGKPYYCAWGRNALATDRYIQSDYIFDDAAIDENKVELWLASTQYSPAEYQLVSDLLVTNGQNIDAKKIGYTSKIIETRMDFRSHAWGAFIPLIISRWINGYGYYSYLTILWPIFFCAIGAFVFSRVNPDKILVPEGIIELEARSGWRKSLWGPYRCRVKKYTKGLRDGDVYQQDYGVINPFGYSFDALLPVIRLREIYYQIELVGWQHYYFYYQKTLGWILGILIVAVFSGLAK